MPTIKTGTRCPDNSALPAQAGTSVPRLPGTGKSHSEPREELLLTVDEFAFLIHRSKRTVHRLAQEGKIRSVRTSTNQNVMIPADELVHCGWTYEMVEQLYG